MERKITTLADAVNTIMDWTERYDVQPSEKQIIRAAGILVDYIGGYGNYAGGEVTVEFNLDEALGRRAVEANRSYEE